jgi:hypothetical protein
MHSRTDAASLHAACTSACDEVDPLRLQTDWGFGNKKKKDNETVKPAEVSRPDVGLYFTCEFDHAHFKNEEAVSGERLRHKYGVIYGESANSVRYFQIRDWARSFTEKEFLLDVKVSPFPVSKTVLFDKNGPLDIANWKTRSILSCNNFVYIIDPEKYFAITYTDTQNKWPYNMPRKDVTAATEKLIRDLMNTDASTNPYIVQHVRADPAPGPDTAWQTDEWPGLKYFRRRSRQVAPAPHTKEASAPDQVRAIMVNKPKHLRTVLDTGQKKKDFYQSTAEGQFEFLKDHYYTSDNSDNKIACEGSKDGHSVYMCFFKVKQYLLQCYIFDNAFERKCKHVLTKNPRDYITNQVVYGDWKVPRNDPNVMWFTNAPHDTQGQKK